MLVMKGDSYACGAIIAAYSLRLNGTKHSLVCMVTPDVTEACRKRMLYVFNEVVEVPYVQYSVKPLRTQKQRGMYNAWVDVAFTKWNMLSLTQYEKCLFVDADKLSTGNMDHLFEEMSTPAGTFSSPWSEPFVERKAAIAARTAASGAAGAGAGGNNRRHYANAKGMYNPYMQNTHNSRVTSSQVYSALTEQSFVVIGTVVLLSPNAEDYAQYRAMLEKLVPFGFSDCHSMMDEQSLSFYFGIYKNQLIQNGEYGKLTGGKQVKIVSTPVCDGAIDAGAVAAAPSAAAVSSSTDASTPSFIAPALPSSAYSEWSYIHHAYNYVPWHRYWLQEDEVPYVFHFFNLKPWVLDRNAWLDLEAWWELVLAMLQDETLPAEAREDLRTIYPAAMLALPKNEGCCWCRLSEESFFLPQDGAWKKHNVFDGKGQLQCPQMKAGLERNAKKRLLEAAAKKE
jgi:alpha-N-acetylglucosamine transferase